MLALVWYANVCFFGHADVPLSALPAVWLCTEQGWCKHTYLCLGAMTLPHLPPHTYTQQPTPTSTPLFAKQKLQTAPSPTREEQETARIYHCTNFLTPMTLLDQIR